jgi:tetraacyldisaccharide-1-P 4'-kinase
MDPAPSEELRRLVARAAPDLPSIRTRNRLVGFAPLDGSAELGAEAFRGRPVGVLLGVARPERVLESIPADVVFTETRPDHEWWDWAEMEVMSHDASRKGAVALLTTGKDAVKMADAVELGILALPLYAIRLETEILDRAPFEALLHRLPLP